MHLEVVSKCIVKHNRDKSLPDTLSLTTAWVRIPAWACEKVDSDLELGGGFRRVLRFLHYLQLASHELATIGINVTKNEIQIQIQAFPISEY